DIARDRRAECQSSHWQAQSESRQLFQLLCGPLGRLDQVSGKLNQSSVSLLAMQLSRFGVHDGVFKFFLCDRSSTTLHNDQTPGIVGQARCIREGGIRGERKCVGGHYGITRSGHINGEGRSAGRAKVCGAPLRSPPPGSNQGVPPPPPRGGNPPPLPPQATSC